MGRIIAGLAKLELEAMKIQEETGLNIDEAREVAKAIIKNRLTSGTPDRKAPSVAAVAGAPVPRQRFQESEILRVISELGYSAKALPKAPPGKRGPKSEVRARLNMSAGVFDLAWERLRSQDEIQDA